ncbi:MAG: helix-turn-helix domain-containing protein [Oscillospiraceae bacterium]|nr:helix-turn-helix domain-containing protein [Oscillospiraceae bacterium]
MEILERLHRVTDLPFTLLDGEGRLLKSWPQIDSSAVSTLSNAAAIEDFRLQRRDRAHPLITFLEPGFLLGVAELSPERYVLIGLVSPYAHSRADVLKMVSGAIHPAHLQQFCDMLLRQPLVSLEKLKDLICLLFRLLGQELHAKDILFVDNVSNKKLGSSLLEHALFDLREEAEAHVPVDYETALCDAVQDGDRVMLERTLFFPRQGRVGRMSVNELRQEKYAFICLATLVSRAAIRGGLLPETAFDLSDLYCQRADLLTEIALIHALCFTMLMDFCGKVREIRDRPGTSPIIKKCLDYISLHLHERITAEQLSQVCNLCRRSLSLRFRDEVGMSIPAYIHQEKIKEAKYLLRHTDYSLSEITSFLRYTSQSHFTRVFKQTVGKTPQQYRVGGR